MKLSGTAALYEQRKQLQKAMTVTDKQIALAEEEEGEVPAKKAKTRKPRTPKALPYDGVIGSVSGPIVRKPNGADAEMQ